MKFIDLQQQYQSHKTEIDAAIHAVLDHGQYILGPEVKSLEHDLAAFVGAKHCIGLASGTAALQVAMMAIGIGPGDEVITSPFSFFATAGTILQLGATPVYVDINPETYNMDPTLLKSAITDKTKAIMPVSLYGQAAEFDQINAIADDFGLPVIEDAAQSLGATYHGRHSGNLSTIACTSFFPSKPLGCYGDGGACFTNDDSLAEKMRMIMNHGQSARYHHVAVGVNARLDTIQAAVLGVKLKYFQAEIDSRQTVAALYDKHLPSSIKRPSIKPYNISAYAQYTIEVDDRQALIDHLASHQIPSAVHYPKGMHQQPVCAANYLDAYPHTEAAASRVMSLPFYPYMPEADVEAIAKVLSSSNA